MGHAEARPLPQLGLTEIRDIDEEEGDADRPGLESGTFQIVARVKRIIRQRLVLEIPDMARPEETKSLGAPIASDAKVKLASMIFAKPGDRVDVKGVEPIRQLAQTFWATDVRVKAGGDSGSPRKNGSAPKAATARTGGLKAKTPGIILKIN